MIGKIFITRSGYDPERGKHIKDPYLGPTPTLGACRPDIRKQLHTGDHIFTISGKVQGLPQFVMGGFEIASKIPATEAFKLFPALRLHQLEDGQLTGNIIVNGRGKQHRLDDHNSFDERIKNYVVGKNLLALRRPSEIALGREETLAVLQDVMRKKGSSAVALVGRWGSSLNEKQVIQIREWLEAITRKAS